MVVGDYKILVNEELNGISEAALEQLIAYKNYFQDGINIRQLPQGFMLQDDPMDSRKLVLHYDKNLDSKNTFSPQPIAQRSRPILSMDLVDRLLDGEQSATFYAQLWKKIQEPSSYSRINNELFRQYLPDLMSLTDTQLTLIKELCGDKDHFDFHKLQFIFEHLEQAKASYSDPYDENLLVSIAWLEPIFTNIEDREKYVSLAHLTETNPSMKSHPFLNLLDKEGFQELTKEIKTHQLTDVQLNGLLGIYNQYGNVGINKILKTWETINQLPNVDLNQLGSIKAHVNGYEALLLNNEDVLNAVRIISGLNPIERQWWNKLYAAHQPMDDYLPNLVASFTKFTTAISNNGLSFYELDDKNGPFFKGAGNLPTTLGRMLSILNLCKEEDIKEQWKAMSRIDLSAAGALRAMTVQEKIDDEEKDRPCGFVIPEMDLNPEKIKENASPIAGYDTCKEFKAIATATNEEDRTRLFYRYIAHQKYRLPLSFYQEAIKLLNDPKIPKESVNNLYALLAASTTGDNYRYFIQDIKTAKAQWNNIITNIKLISIPTIPGVNTEVVKIKVSEELASLKSLPGLPVLEKLVLMMSQPMQNVGYLDLMALKSQIPRLEQSYELLNYFVNKYGNNIYLGMKFYGEDDFKKTYPEKRTLFEEHLEVCNKIEALGVAEQLFPLVSSFKISTTSVDEVAKSLKQFNMKPHTIVSVVLDYTLRMLLDMGQINGLDPRN